MNLDFSSFSFESKPIIFAGKAMEFHGLRRGGDIDSLLDGGDFDRCAEAFADCLSLEAGEPVIRQGLFEFKKQVEGYSYHQLRPHTQEQETFLVLSPLFLLLLKCLEIEKEKNQRDIRLLARHLLATLCMGQIRQKEHDAL